MAEILKEQIIESETLQAIAYRNIHRTKVDKIFGKKYNLPKYNKKDPANNLMIRKRMRAIDQKARQLWRQIIKHSNTL
jgi:hypothetical protein